MDNFREELDYFYTVILTGSFSAISSTLTLIWRLFTIGSLNVKFSSLGREEGEREVKLLELHC